MINPCKKKESKGMNLFKSMISHEDQLIRQQVITFAQNEIAPYAHQWEEDEWFPKELHKKAGEMGILGLGFDEQYGGTGTG